MYLSRFSHCRYKEEFFELLAEQVVEYYGEWTFAGVFERLAELIWPGVDDDDD